MTQEELPPAEEIPPIEPSPLKEEKNEAEEYKDKYLRLLAEMENMRKRLQKEKQDMMRFASENIMEEFLSPIDNLENALKHTQGMSAETQNWVKGFEMIAEQFKSILTQNGISAYDSVGKTFDPFLHEAVEIEEVEEGPENVVVQEYIKGYQSSSRTIRPARVKVAKKKSSLEKPNH